MEVSRGVAADFGTLTVLGIEGQPQSVEHDIQDASLDRFEAVTDVGQSAGGDDRHGIVEVPSTGFLADGNVLNSICTVTSIAAVGIAAFAFRGDGLFALLTFRVTFRGQCLLRMTQCCHCQLSSCLSKFVKATASMLPDTAAR